MRFRCQFELHASPYLPSLSSQGPLRVLLQSGVLRVFNPHLFFCLSIIRSVKLSVDRSRSRNLVPSVEIANGPSSPKSNLFSYSSTSILTAHLTSCRPQHAPALVTASRASYSRSRTQWHQRNALLPLPTRRNLARLLAALRSLRARLPPLDRGLRSLRRGVHRPRRRRIRLWELRRSWWVRSRGSRARRRQGQGR